MSEIMINQETYYETMYILRPDIAEEEVSNHIENYNNLLEKIGGKILDSQMRGKRRLAYPIAKNREGIYVQLSHQGDGQHIAKFEKAMRLSEDVIRYMTIKQEGPLPTPKPSKKSSQNTEKQEAEEATNESSANKTSDEKAVLNTKKQEAEEATNESSANKISDEKAVLNTEKQEAEEATNESSPN